MTKTEADWVELALKTMNCNQKALAKTLGVSTSQVSKWKAGESMSSERTAEFRKLTGVKSHYPDFVLWVGSVENADKWAALIQELADDAEESSETGYDSGLGELDDENTAALWCSYIAATFREMGVKDPTEFPEELVYVGEDDFEGDDDDYDDAENERLSKVHDNKYASIIRRLFVSYTDIAGFYFAYVGDIVDARDRDDDIKCEDMDGGEFLFTLRDLAVCKIEVDPVFAPKMGEFRHKTLEFFAEKIRELKSYAFKKRIPLKAELGDLIAFSHEKIGCEAERESLGVNDTEAHPDIYMNELLCRMRSMSDAIEKIMEKLGIEGDGK
jgi:transcriptional regulator with XRE-family HTH domain